MSNIDKLVDAGIIDSHKTLTPVQTDAIEDLTVEEVDALISSRDKLYPRIQDDDQIIQYPGIPHPPSTQS